MYFSQNDYEELRSYTGEQLYKYFYETQESYNSLLSRRDAWDFDTKQELIDLNEDIEETFAWLSAYLDELKERYRAMKA